MYVITMNELKEIRALSRYAFLLLAGSGAERLCASAQQAPPHPDDPWEGFNRKVYTFNDAVDRAFLIPATTGYQAL